MLNLSNLCWGLYMTLCMNREPEVQELYSLLSLLSQIPLPFRLEAQIMAQQKAMAATE